MPEIGDHPARGAHAPADRHLGGGSRDEDPRQVPARARERGVGPPPGPDVRQELPAHVRRRARASTGGSWSRSTSSATSGCPTSSCSRSPRPGRARGGAGAAPPAARAPALAHRRPRRPGARRVAVAPRARRLERRHGHDPRRSTPTTTTRRGRRERHDGRRAPAPRSARRGREDRAAPGPPVGPGLRVPGRRARPAADPRLDAAGRRRLADVPLVSASASTWATATSACGSTGTLRAVPPSSSAIGYEITRRGRDAAPARAAPDLRVGRGMAARAGIVVTGTEVLTGRVRDRNGPWLAERLRELGVDLADTVVVGDRPADMRRGAALAGRRGDGRGRHQRRPRARPPTT